MTLKYKITDFQHPDNPKLFRIRALRHIPRFRVRAGDLGGYIEHEGNLSQTGDCWVDIDARVFEDGEVYGNAVVFGHARIYGDAKVFEKAKVYDQAMVFGNARIYGEAKVHGGGRIYGDTQIYAYAQVYGHAWVTGDTILNEHMIIGQERIAEFMSSAQIYYADGVTAYIDVRGQLIVNGNSPDFELYKMLAMLKLS